MTGLELPHALPFAPRDPVSLPPSSAPPTSLQHQHQRYSQHKMVGMGHSYISSDDLQSLDLSPSSRINIPLSNSPLSSPSLASTDDKSTTTTSIGQTKRVAFCPLALLIQCAAEGEKDPALVLGLDAQHQQQKGRTRIAVRTYSLDTPNLSSATTRAWRSVCAGFNSSLQPLLTPSHSVRSPSPEREREKTSFARSRSCSDPAVPEFRGRQRKEEEEEVGFIPDGAGGEGRGLKIRLPGLTRKCCPSLAASPPPCKGILKPCSFSSATSPSPSTAPAVDAPPLPSAEPSADAFPPLSPIPTHPSPLSLSRSHSPITHLSTSAAPPPTPGPGDPQIIPLAPCCSTCSAGAEYGRSCGEGEYVEKWSKSARRKRRRDSKAAEERAEFGAWKAGSGSEEEEEEGDGEAGEGEKGLKGAVVDEVQCQRMRRGETDDLEVFAEEEEQGSGEDSEEGSPSTTAQSSTPTPSKKEPTTTTNTTALLTPPLSPESAFSSKELAPVSKPFGGAPPSPPSPPTSPSSESAPPLITTPQPSTSTSTPTSSAPAPTPTPPAPAPKRRFSLSMPSLPSASRVLSGAGRGIVEAGMVAGVGGAGGRWG